MTARRRDGERERPRPRRNLRLTPSPPPRADAGFVLVAVLWMLALLAGLATIYSAYARASAAASALPIERLRSEAAIRSGVELAVYRLLSAPKEARPSRGSFEFPLGAARVAVSFLPDAARIGLNAASKELLGALIQGFGLKPEAAAAAAAHIVAWRQPAAGAAPGPEDQAYRDAGLPYGPRHGPFQDSLELALIPGLDPSLVERLLPHVTVYAGGAVDADDADDIVRAALAASGPAAAAGAAAPAAAPALAGGTAPMIFRAFLAVATPGRRTIHADVVFELQDQGDEPYHVLFWRDDFDAPLGA